MGQWLMKSSHQPMGQPKYTSSLCFICIRYCFSVSNSVQIKDTITMSLKTLKWTLPQSHFKLARKKMHFPSNNILWFEYWGEMGCLWNRNTSLVEDRLDLLQQIDYSYLFTVKWLGRSMTETLPEEHCDSSWKSLSVAPAKINSSKLLAQQ